MKCEPNVLRISLTFIFCKLHNLGNLAEVQNAQFPLNWWQKIEENIAAGSSRLWQYSKSTIYREHCSIGVATMCYNAMMMTTKMTMTMMTTISWRVFGSWNTSGGLWIFGYTGFNVLAEICSCYITQPFEQPLDVIKTVLLALCLSTDIIEHN